MNQYNLQTLLDRVADNTHSPNDMNSLGLLYFAKTHFPEIFRNEWAPHHYDMCQMFFALLSPNLKRRDERLAYFLVHREAAKSTVGTFLFPIFNIYCKGLKVWTRHNALGWEGADIHDHTYEEVTIGEDFMVITSETSGQSERFVSDIKAIIEERDDLASIYGEKKGSLIELEPGQRRKDQKWTQTAFLTSDNTVVLGAGSGQRIRGLKIRGHRPSFIMIDDMYSRLNTKTMQTRENLNNWFFSDLLKSADSERAKILWLGTMVHPDTVVKRFRQTTDWHGIERPIISIDELQVGLQNCLVNGEPDKPLCNTWQKTMTTLSWPDRHTLYDILKLYTNDALLGQLNYFYQEYMNESLAPENKLIDHEAFVRTNITYEEEGGKSYVTFFYEHIEWRGEVLLSLACDPAASASERADDTVIMVGGYARCFPRAVGTPYELQELGMPNGRIFPILLHIEGGKYSTYDYNEMPGICEAILALDKRYKLDMIKIEANGQQAQIEREVRRSMLEGIYKQGEVVKSSFRSTPVWAEYQTSDKKERIITTVLSIVQAHKVFICNDNKHIDKLYLQLIAISLADHDDYADALAMVFKGASIPAVYNLHVWQNGEDQVDRVEQLKEIYGMDYWMYL